jgi:hypothetical protein
MDVEDVPCRKDIRRSVDSTHSNDFGGYQTPAPLYQSSSIDQVDQLPRFGVPATIANISAAYSAKYSPLTSTRGEDQRTTNAERQVEELWDQLATDQPRTHQEYYYNPSIENGVPCGFAYLGCSHKTIPHDRYGWSEHIISHFEEPPLLLNCKCHLCHESILTSDDASVESIKDIWSDCLGHCWKHIRKQGNSLEQNALLPFFKEGALLHYDGTYRVFKDGCPDDYDNCEIFKNPVTLKHGEIYDTKNHILKPHHIRIRQRSFLSPTKTLHQALEKPLYMALLKKSKNYVERAKPQVHNTHEKETTTFPDKIKTLSSSRNHGDLSPFGGIKTTRSVKNSFSSIATSRSLGTNTEISIDTLSTSVADLSLEDVLSDAKQKSEHDHSEAIEMGQILLAEQEGKKLTPSTSHHSSAPVSVGETACSEDETDWDAESSSDYILDQAGLQPQPFGEGRQDSSLLEQQFTSTQLNLIDRLMKEFWIIFDHRWQPQSRQRGDAAASPQSTQPASSSSRKTSDSAWTSSKSAKRARSSQDGESDNDNDRPSKRKEKEPASRRSSEVPVRFACPYRKHNPKKYSVQIWRTCALTPQTTVARVKYDPYLDILLSYMLTLTSGAIYINIT